MLLKMAALRVRLTPLAGYLLTLAIYSGFMCLRTLRRDLALQEQMEYREMVDDDYGGTGPVQVRRFPRNSDRPKFRKVDDFYSWLRSPETSCRKMLRVGGTSCRRTFDNDKMICLDPDVALVPNNCTVYSFGIGFDQTFDDMVNHFGCDVFMFDPTINYTELNRNLFKREKFYPIGLHDTHYAVNYSIHYGVSNSTEVILGNYEPYEKIREIIGHQNKTVHYLKLDIENAEWDVVPYMFDKGSLSGVLQLAIEIHTMNIIKLPKEKVIGQLETYTKTLIGLERLGFRRVYYRPNLVQESMYHIPGENRTIPTCAEVLYLRRGPVL